MFLLSRVPSTPAIFRFVFFVFFLQRSHDFPQHIIHFVYLIYMRNCKSSAGGRVTLRGGSLGWHNRVPLEGQPAFPRVPGFKRLNSPSRGSQRHAEYAQTDISTFSSPFNTVISKTETIIANACTGECIYTDHWLTLHSIFIIVLLLPYLAIFMLVFVSCFHLQRSCLTVLIYFAICSFVFFAFIFSAAV